MYGWQLLTTTSVHSQFLGDSINIFICEVEENKEQFMYTNVEYSVGLYLESLP